MAKVLPLPKELNPDFYRPNKKPVGPVDVNDGINMLDGFLLSEQETSLTLRNKITGQSASPSGSSTFLDSTPRGRYLGIRGGEYYDISSARTRDYIASGKPFTIAWLMSPRQTNVNGAAWGFGGVDDLIFYPRGDGSGRIRLFWRDYGGNIIDVNVSDNTTGKVSLFVFTSNGSNSHKMYFDGREVDSSTATGSIGPFSTGPYLGAWSDDPSGQNTQVDIFSYVILKEELSGAAVKNLYDGYYRELTEPKTFTPYLVPDGAPAVPAISADQDEEGDTQSAALSPVVELSANQTEVGDTQAATISNVISITANQQEGGDTQAAEFSFAILILADQFDGGDTQAAVIFSGESDIATYYITGLIKGIFNERE